MAEPAGKKKIFIICPVRGMTDEEKSAIQWHVLKLEGGRDTVFWPFRDNPAEEVDPIGLEICIINRRKLEEADEVHVYWNGKSEGSFFDLGMAMALRKQIVLINEATAKDWPLAPGSAYARFLDYLLNAVENSIEFRVSWSGRRAHLFSFGAAFALRKRVVLLNADSLPRTGGKSFPNVLHELHRLARTV